MKKLIEISRLPVIKDPQTFFNTDKVLSIAVITVDESVNIQHFKNLPVFDLIHFNGKNYMVFVLKGSPHNFLLNLKDGFPVKVGSTESVIIFLDHRNFPSMLSNGQFFDISQYAVKADTRYSFNYEWLCEKFITPYEPGKKLSKVDFLNLTKPEIQNLSKLVIQNPCQN